MKAAASRRSGGAGHVVLRVMSADFEDDDNEAVGLYKRRTESRKEQTA